MTYSTTDADTDAAGHQVDLSEGRNTVTITITAEDTTTTKAYTLNLNRSVYSQFGWLAENDFDTLSQRGNSDPAGIFTDGETMWVADVVDDRIYGYDLSTGAENTRGQVLRGGNDDPTGIWSDGETMWVADDVDDKVYAYDLSTSLRDEDKEWDLDSSNGLPYGLWSDGTTMWVSDTNDGKLYAYTLAGGTRDSDKDISVTRASGIWSDGTTIWVTDIVNSHQLLAYTLATGARDSDKDFTTPHAAGNRGARGITSDGRTMWVADIDDDKLYAYALVARSTDATLSALTVDGAAVPEALTSAAVGPVGLYLRDKRGSPPTGAPAVSGEVRQGETLRADVSGIADPDGLDNATFSYLWLAGDTVVEGATGSSYTLVGSDTGKAIKVVVVFLDDAGNREVLTSAATPPVVADRPDPPSNLAAPAQAHNGVTLTWDDPGDSTVESYQVLRRSRDAARFGDNRGATEFVVVGEIDAPATAYTDTAVTPRTRYVYKVRAQNAGGPGELSAQVYAETPHQPAPTSATGAPSSAAWPGWARR